MGFKPASLLLASVAACRALSVQQVFFRNMGKDMKAIAEADDTGVPTFRTVSDGGVDNIGLTLEYGGAVYDGLEGTQGEVTVRQVSTPEAWQFQEITITSDSAQPCPAAIDSGAATDKATGRRLLANGGKITKIVVSSGGLDYNAFSATPEDGSPPPTISVTCASDQLRTFAKGGKITKIVVSSGGLDYASSWEGRRLLMEKGTVKFFNEAKGFGFVVDQSVRFAYTAEKRLDQQKQPGSLAPFDYVAYEVQEGKKGLNAVNVKKA